MSSNVSKLVSAYRQHLTVPWQVGLAVSRHDEIVGLSKAWGKAADEMAKRFPAWHKLNDLLSHAKALGPYSALKAEVDAIEAQRSLLAVPALVRPLLDKAVDLLRLALNAKLDGFEKAFQQQSQLQSDPDWLKLKEEQRVALVSANHLSAPAPLPLGTSDQLLDSLDDCSLEHWVSKIQALPSRFEAARHAAVQLLKPNVVYASLPQCIRQRREGLARRCRDVDLRKGCFWSSQPLRQVGVQTKPINQFWEKTK